MKTILWNYQDFDQEDISMSYMDEYDKWLKKLDEADPLYKELVQYRMMKRTWRIVSIRR